jgi:glucose dehydrogenase
LTWPDTRAASLEVLMRLPSHKLITFTAALLLSTGLLTLGLVAADDKLPYTTWSSYLGTPDSAQYSALKQIDKSNVRQLRVEWTYPSTGGAIHRFGPLVVDDVMYVATGSRAIVALDAATGKEIWSRGNEGRVGDRGISYWESADRADRRLFYVTEAGAAGTARHYEDTTAADHQSGPCLPGPHHHVASGPGRAVLHLESRRRAGLRRQDR